MGRALRGINLGGWLVAERWMTPDLFTGVEGKGEIELTRQLGREEAAFRLDKHRSTFITEEDFRWIYIHGFEVIRLPVGYWIVTEDESDYIPGEQYIQKAFRWAKKYHIKLILDLHGLPGSQNGKDHSGQVGKVHFYRRHNRERALGILDYILGKYGRRPELIGIEIINEPRWPLFSYRFTRYCREAYMLILERSPERVKCIVSDGFQTRRMVWFLKRLDRDRKRLVVDVHLYQVFSPKDRRKNAEDYLHIVRTSWQKLLNRAGGDVEIMVGEWSAATGSYMDSPDFTRSYYEAQEEVFSMQVWAYCYWSYKAPRAGSWDLRAVVEAHHV